MSLNANITRVISASAASEHTGSFVKLYCPVATTFTRIEFGKSKISHYLDGNRGFASGSRILTSQITGVTGQIPSPAGSYIEGPIAAFRISVGGVLAYDTQ